MCSGAEAIAQGVLWNPQNQTYGAPDLLIRSDVLRRLFPDALPASAIEGDGIVQEYIGGYEDWLRQRKVQTAAAPLPATPNPKLPPAGGIGPSSSSSLQQAASASALVSAAKKLSYRERRELDALPAQIEALETERDALAGTIADPAFYKEPTAAIASALERLQQIDGELADLYARWDALDSRPLCQHGNRAEANQRVLGAPIGFAADVGDGETQVDEVVTARRERGVVERLQHGAGDEVRLAVPALTRPGVQDQPMLLGPTSVAGHILDVRFAERHVGKRRRLRRLVVNVRSAEQRDQR